MVFLYYRILNNIFKHVNVDKEKAMKNCIFFLIAMLTVIVMVSCSKNPTEPKVDDQIIDDPVENVVGKISLVPLSADGLSKATTDAIGQMWLPASEISTLTKTAAASIEFGQINSTTGLMFVIMNTGNTDVFDVQFTSTDLDITPANIALIKVSTQGAELTALPIVTITKEHVLPKSGVGSLLEMNVGDFTDILSISYNYEISGDTVEVVDDYDVGGTKMGAIIELELSGRSLNSIDPERSTFFMQPHNFDFTSYTVVSDADMDTALISNIGNVPLRIRVFFSRDRSTAFDGVVQANSSIDLFGILRGSNFAVPDSSGDSIILGDDSNQPYILSFDGRTFVNGVTGLFFRGD